MHARDRVSQAILSFCFSSRRRHTRFKCDWSSDVCSSDLLHIQYSRNDLAPYFFEDIRKYLEATYGTEAVHERGLRVYTTLNINMQRIANQSLRDGVHAYERRHGWKGNLPNVVRDNLGKLDAYYFVNYPPTTEKGS